MGEREMVLVEVVVVTSNDGWWGKGKIITGKKRVKKKTKEKRKGIVYTIF